MYFLVEDCIEFCFISTEYTTETEEYLQPGVNSDPGVVFPGVRDRRHGADPASTNNLPLSLHQ